MYNKNIITVFRICTGVVLHWKKRSVISDYYARVVQRWRWQRHRESVVVRRSESEVTPWRLTAISVCKNNNQGRGERTVVDSWRVYTVVTAKIWKPCCRTLSTPHPMAISTGKTLLSEKTVFLNSASYVRTTETKHRSSIIEPESRWNRIQFNNFVSIKR